MPTAKQISYVHNVWVRKDGTQRVGLAHSTRRDAQRFMVKTSVPGKSRVVYQIIVYLKRRK